MDTMEPVPRERSVGVLFGELATETSTLVRQEVQLATSELTQKAASVGRPSIRVLVGATLGVVSLMAVVGAIVLVLAFWIPLWASALVVGGVLGAIAYGVANSGLTAIKRLDLRPTQTIASLKDDKTWLTQQLH